MTERKLINPDILQGIADAIREKGKTTEPIKVSELPDAICALNGVGEATQEVVEVITGIHAEDDIPLSNVIAKASVSDPTEQVLHYGKERATAGGAPIKDGVAYVQSLKGQSLKMVSIFDMSFNIFHLIGGNGVERREEGDSVIFNGVCNIESGYYDLDIIRITNGSVLKNLETRKILVDLGTKFITDGSSFFRVSFKSAWDTRKSVRAMIINTIEKSATFRLLIRIGAGFEFNNVVFKPRIYDLTTMGMEDVTTPDEFAQRLGYASIDDVPCIPYTEGEICNMTAESIVSKGTEGAEISTFPFNLSDIKDAEGNELFPYGLCKVEGVADEITETQAIKRIKAMPLNTLIQLYDAYYKIFSSNQYHKAGAYHYFPALIMGYTYNNSERESLNDLKHGYWSSTTPDRIAIKNLAYDNVEDFRANHEGVMVYYQLSEPIVVDLPARKQWYKAENGGTEELQSETFSAPLTAEIGYRYDIDPADTLTANELI